MADEYPPVESPDEEEERRKNLDFMPPIVAPASRVPAYAREATMVPPSFNVPPAGNMEALRPIATPPAAPPPIQTPAQNRLRTLTEQGAPPVQPLHGWKKALDVAGQIAVPHIEEAIRYRPQAEYAKNLAAAKSDVAAETAPEAAAAETKLKEAQGQEASARAESLRNPPEKQGLTPEETTIHDLMTGENGNPRINPETQKPYTYLEAYSAMEKAKQTKPERANTPEQQFIDEYVKAHPGATVGDAVKAYAGATQKPEREGAAADRANARADRSYQFHSQRIDKLATPVEQRLERIGRLEDTLSQGTPQADALVAPELLSVMAGGQASGLRMNEAEIARIVGGRTVWESLKAKVNAWQLDPNKGFALTPAQRQQVKDLFAVVKQRAEAKAKILDDARGRLAESDDPTEHRKIYNAAAKSLQEADTQGAAGNEPPRPANVPKDYIFQENGPQGRGWYRPKPKGQ